MNLKNDTVSDESISESVQNPVVPPIVTPVQPDWEREAAALPVFDEEDIVKRGEMGILEEEIQAVLSSQSGRYHFEQLNSDEQGLYAELLLIMEKLGAEIPLSTLETETIERIFQCVLNDHPEIFYVEGYTFTQYSLEDEVRKITFSGSYSMDAQEIEDREDKIKQYTEVCLSNMPSYGDDYTKVKFIYEYVINNTEYDAQAQDNQNICSVFLSGKSVCQGYAKAVQYLLGEINIPSTLVMGKVSGGEGHAWNLVLINGNYYYLDATWGDASYQIEEGNSDLSSEALPPINYDYLCVTTAHLERTHIIDAIVPLPVCDASQDNYYVREGMYFTEVDEERLESLFKGEYEKGSTYITIKCSTMDIYNQMLYYMIEEQKIFRYLRSEDGVVAYADSAEQLSLSFWL